jgi:hypothetical protein
LVKGFSAAALYGEDVNRNGIMDLNEDDGDESFPYYDNADGVLNVGIAPFLTVNGREWDQALDNKPRINLNADGAVVAAQIAEQFQNGELSDATIAFITSLAQSDFNFAQLRSPADLYVLEEVLGGPGEAAPQDQDQQEPNTPARPNRPGRPSEDDPNEGGEQGMPNAPGQESPGEGEEQGEGEGRGEEGSEDENEGEPNISGAPYVIPQQLRGSPVTLEELPYIMDRFSVRSAEQASTPIQGLIHLNAAPQRVLEMAPGMTPDAAALIVAKRRELDEDTLRTTAWPLTTGTIDAPTYKAFAAGLTTKSQQFRVEIVAYADHLKVMRRYEWIIEMVGPLAQVKYWRDLSSLGPAWPVDDDTLVVTQP